MQNYKVFTYFSSVSIVAGGSSVWEWGGEICSRLASIGLDMGDKLYDTVEDVKKYF